MGLQIKFFTLALLGLILVCNPAFAQEQESAARENRLSIGLMGGVTTGHLNLGNAIEDGGYKNFDVKEQLNSTVGFNIRYAATKDIALQSNIMLGKFSLLSDYYHQDALSFKNNYITTSITTQLSLIRLLGAKSDYVNLYGSFGGGLMVNDVSVSTTSEEVASRGITPSDHPPSTFFSTFGGGIRFNLGYRLDSFAQYDYHSASRDIIDGNFIGDLLAVNGAAETANSWSTVTVGLQYKFGSGAADSDWPGVALRPTTPATTPERDVFEQLEDLLARQADFYEREMEQLANQVDALRAELEEERRMREEEARKEEEEEEKEEEDAYAAIIREMQSRIDSLEKALAEERKIAEPPVADEEDAQIIAETEVTAEEETEMDDTAGIAMEADAEDVEAAEADIETEEEILPHVFEEVNIDLKDIRPVSFETGVRDSRPVLIDTRHVIPAYITMEDLMGLLAVPDEEPAAEEEITEPGMVDEMEAEELAITTFEEQEEIAAEVPEQALREEDLALEDWEEDLTVEDIDADPAETEITPETEITFDEIMEFARSIMIEEDFADDTEEDEVIAEVYEKITEQQPEIRLLADSLTIIHALNELKRGLEEDSTITISEVPDTHVETPKREPKVISPEEVLADRLDDRALKTGLAPDDSDEVIVEHPVEEYLQGQTDRTDAASDELVAEAAPADESESTIETPVLEEAPADDLSEELQQTEEDLTESDPADRTDSPMSNWPVFAFIAAVLAGLLFYLSKFFRTEKDLDE